MKIGIVTLYYNSTNYGGVLQAYALCKALNQLGYQAEQIQLDVRGTSLNNDLPNSSTAFAKALHFIKKVKNFLQCRLTRFFKKRAIARVGEEINTTFENFRTITTPHSEVVYNKENIAECEKNTMPLLREATRFGILIGITLHTF